MAFIQLDEIMLFKHRSNTDTLLQYIDYSWEEDNILILFSDYMSNYTVHAGVWIGISSLNNRYVFAAVDSGEKVWYLCSTCMVWLLCIL